MSERIEVISVVDYQGDLSWRINPDEFEAYINRLGVEEFKRKAHKELDAAIEKGIIVLLSKVVKP